METRRSYNISSVLVKITKKWKFLAPKTQNFGRFSLFTTIMRVLYERNPIVFALSKPVTGLIIFEIGESGAMADVG